MFNFFTKKSETSYKKLVEVDNSKADKQVALKEANKRLQPSTEKKEDKTKKT